MGRTLVIGLGNPLMGDDGLGPAVVEKLQARGLPGVELIDGGVAGLGLVTMMEGAERILFIDAARMGTSPGTIRVFRPQEVKTLKPSSEFTLHGMDVLSLIELARAVDIEPEITIVGVEPFHVEPRYALSEPMEQILDKVVTTTLEAIGPPASAQV